MSSDLTSNESNLMRILPTYSLRFVMLGLLGLSSKCVDDDIMTTTIHRELRFAMSSYLLSTIFSDFVSCLGDVVEVPCCEIGCRRDCFTKLLSQPMRWTDHISQTRKSTRHSSLVHVLEYTVTRRIVYPPNDKHTRKHRSVEEVIQSLSNPDERVSVIDDNLR